MHVSWVTLFQSCSTSSSPLHIGHKGENREIFKQTLKILFLVYIELLPFIKTFLTLSEIPTYTIRSDSFFKVNDILMYFFKYLQVLSEILGILLAEYINIKFLVWMCAIEFDMLSNVVAKLPGLTMGLFMCINFPYTRFLVQILNYDLELYLIFPWYGDSQVSDTGPSWPSCHPYVWSHI